MTDGMKNALRYIENSIDVDQRAINQVKDCFKKLDEIERIYDLWNNFAMDYESHRAMRYIGEILGKE